MRPGSDGGSEARAVETGAAGAVGVAGTPTQVERLGVQGGGAAGATTRVERASVGAGNEAARALDVAPARGGAAVAADPVSSRPLAPYYAGAAAARRREPLVYNPHPKRSSAYEAWEGGWHDYTDARRGRGLLDVVSLDAQLDQKAQLYPELAREATRRLPGRVDELTDWKHYAAKLPSPGRLERLPPEVRRFYEDIAAFDVPKGGSELTSDEILGRLRSGNEQGVGYRRLGRQYTGDLQEALRHVPDRFKADFAGGYQNRIASYKHHVGEVTLRHLTSVEQLDLALHDLKDSLIAGQVVKSYYDRALVAATVDEPLTSRGALELGYRLGLQTNSVDLDKITAARNLPNHLHLEILRGYRMGYRQSVWHLGSLAGYLPHDPRLEPLAVHRLRIVRPTVSLEDQLYLLHQGPWPKFELLEHHNQRIDAARKLGLELGRDRAWQVVSAVRRTEVSSQVQKAMGRGFLEGRRLAREWVEAPDLAHRNRLAAGRDYGFWLGRARYPLAPVLQADVGDELRQALTEGHAEGVAAVARSRVVEMDGLARSALIVRSADHRTSAAASAARLKLERSGGLAAIAQRLGLTRTRDYFRASSASAAQVLARSSLRLDRIRSLLPRITGGMVDLGSLLSRSEIRGLAHASRAFMAVVTARWGRAVASGLQLAETLGRKLLRNLGRGWSR